MPPSLSTQKKPNLSARIEIAKALLLTCAGTLNFNLAREKQSKNPWGILQTWQHRHSCKHPKKYRYTYIHIYVVFIYIKTRKHHLKCHQMWIIHHRVGDSFPPHLCSTWCCFPQSCIQRDWPLGTTEPNVKTCGRNHSLCQKCAKVKAYLNRRGEKLDRFGTSLSDNVSERWCLYFSKKWASDCEPSSVALAASTILLKCACCSGAKLVFWQTFLGVIERLQSSLLSPKKTSPRISQTCFGENNFLPTRIGIWLGGQESSLHILLVDDQATPVRTPKKKNQL